MRTLTLHPFLFCCLLPIWGRGLDKVVKKGQRAAGGTQSGFGVKAEVTGYVLQVKRYWSTEAKRLPSGQTTAVFQSLSGAPWAPPSPTAQPDCPDLACRDAQEHCLGT